MLRIVNGIMVNIPNTLGVENVMQVLNNRSHKGNAHIIAFTEAKPKTKAKEENMDLIKITDLNCFLGIPRSKKPKSTTWEPNFTRIDNVLIQYANGDIAISTQANKRIKGKSYYVDRNTGRVYDKQYLLDNEYIYKQSPRQIEEGEPLRATFKLDKIIYIK